jgi:hypothetical protein
MISQPVIERFDDVRVFAVRSRKPTFVRWAEEAEAKQVLERAGLEQICDRRDIDPERSLEPGQRLLFLRRLYGLFSRQHPADWPRRLTMSRSKMSMR